MVFRKLSLFATGLVITAVAHTGSAQNIYSVGKQQVNVENLPDALKQKFYEIDAEAYEKKKAVISDNFFEEHIKELAAKQSKTEAQVSNDLLGVKEPTEDEMKKWYEENKARIPYPYDSIKDQITKFLKAEQAGNKKTAFLEKLKKEKNFKLALKSPEQPVIKINSEGFPVKGKKGAKIQIVEFADYYCPHCKHAYEAFDGIMKKYSSKIELTFMDFPIRGEQSKVIARGAFCAGKQGKFWEYHGEAFTNQEKLNDNSPGEFAKSLKLNESDFGKCLSSKEATDHVDKSAEEGRRIGVSGTPSIYINGKKVNGHDMADLEKAIKKLM